MMRLARRGLLLWGLAVFCSIAGGDAWLWAASPALYRDSQAGGNETPHEYHDPLFYSRVGEAILVFMLLPDAPVDLLATGPSPGEPGGVRGVSWKIADSQKDEVYRLSVRIRLLPFSRSDELLPYYKQWIRNMQTETGSEQ